MEIKIDIDTDLPLVLNFNTIGYYELVFRYDKTKLQWLAYYQGKFGLGFQGIAPTLQGAISDLETNFKKYFDETEIGD